MLLYVSGCPGLDHTELPLSLSRPSVCSVLLGMTAGDKPPKSTSRTHRAYLASTCAASREFGPVHGMSSMADMSTEDLLALDDDEILELLAREQAEGTSTASMDALDPDREEFERLDDLGDQEYFDMLNGGANGWAEAAPEVQVSAVQDTMSSF